MLILKWKQSHWWIAGFGGVGRGRGMSSYLDVREPNHQLHQQVWVLPIISARCVVGSPGWPWEERWTAGDGQSPCHLQVFGTLMATKIFIYLSIFLKVLLLIVVFVRTDLFSSSLGISIVFIEGLLSAQECVRCVWVLFPDFWLQPSGVGE